MKQCLLWIGVVVFSIAYGQELEISWRTPFCKIGEQTQLKMRLKNAPDSVVHIPLFGEINCALSENPKENAPMGLMEFMGTFHDTTYLKGKQRIWEGVYTVIPWDTGSYYLQPLQVELPGALLTGKVPRLDVTFRDLAKNHDITELQSTIPADVWLWLRKYGVLLLTLLLLTAALIFFYRRKKKQRELALTLSERTLLEIDKLQKEGLWKTKEYSLHYVRFSYILRNYLGEIYQLNLMERTSNETILLLKGKGLGETLLGQIQHLFYISDRVKFAQDTPSESTVLEGLKELKSLVHSVATSVENTIDTNG